MCIHEVRCIPIPSIIGGALFGNPLYDTCLLVVSKVDHSSGIPRKDCNIMNSTVCLTVTLIGIRVVVGGWKSLAFTIQMREQRQICIETPIILGPFAGQDLHQQQYILPLPQ